MSLSEDGAEQFTLAATVLAVLGCLLAMAAPFLGSPPSSFRGNMTATGLVGLVFAGQHLRVVREVGNPRLAPAALTTLFGVLFAVSPLLYADVGFPGTAGAQFAGVLTGAFGAYTTFEAVELLARGER